MTIRKTPHALAILMLAFLAGCDHAAEQDHAHGHGHEAEAHDDYERGPNGGRLLADGPFALEITIFEAGVPPQFRIYPSLDGQPVDPAQVELTIELERLGGPVDRFRFRPEADYLVGDGVVTEPHSFDVRVAAAHRGNRFAWDYQSHEGRTTIAAEMARAAGVAVAPAGPAMIEETLDVLGRVDLAPGARAELRARFPGQVVAVYKTVGEGVAAGERLARVESNESLQAYDIVSPMDGVVLEGRTNVGDVAGNAALFVVGDPARLSIDFHVFPKDLHRVALGQPVQIRSIDGRLTGTTRIAAFLPTKELETQTVLARAPLSNPDGGWMPGMTVGGDIVVGREEVPLAVRTAALQRFRDFTVVFARIGETYEVRMLKLGRQTPEWTEVLGGIRPGRDYVTENSFLIKADVEKSGASHDH
ncbi:MAG: efflux RND transporter periplasmic adaptor subunit [Sphingomonadales bacterium]|nr:efflux RND transporter periplasmic adaptor subunit [Sphingomonadales bacterium]